VPTFDPDTGKLVDPDALRSIQVNAAGFRTERTMVDRAADVKHVEIINPDDGSTVGMHTHHSDGRMAAEVVAQTPQIVGAPTNQE
jgi:hypothetical protein